ncbi:hypothetical protein L218DRAFT_1080018 [Marasmius fiardii PR-910]|nr:hypothetical protein L218DRAFT_1080018 [Marasmius fiardii PR-910]
MSFTTPSSPQRSTTPPSPSRTTTEPSLEESFSGMGIGYPTEFSGAVYHRVVRFDSECVLIPELHKSKKPLMVTKSYAIPLWKRRATSGESSEETQDSPSSSPTTGGVVFKLPLPSFMAKPTRSPSRTRECSRPPCLVNSDPSYTHSQYIRQPRLSNPTLPSNALPNAILVVDTHNYPHLNQVSSSTLSSPSPIGSAFSEASSGSGGGTKSPINRSPVSPFTMPTSLTTPTISEGSTLGSSQKEKQGNGRDKDREREKDKDRIITVPLRACCQDCFHVTEECARNGDQWKERFSKGARRRRGSSVSSVGSSEAEDNLGMYSPMASYKPLRDLVKEKEGSKVEDKPNSNSNSQGGLTSTSSTSTSAIADDEDEEVVSSLSLAVRVDEVDCIQGSSIGRLKRQPSAEQLDTEDDEPSNLPPGTLRGRETSYSSVGSSSSTFSAMSGVSSATSNPGAEETSPEPVCDQPPPPVQRPRTQPLPSHSINFPSSYTMATRGKRRRKPSTPIKETEEPPEEKYEGYCRDRERGRSRREHHRLKALKTRNLDADDDDVNMLFPLPSPRRSPSSSPLNTPQGSATPTNGGSGTPSPNPSPTPSSSAVHLTNAPKKRSRLGIDETEEAEPSPLLDVGEDEDEVEVETGPCVVEAKSELSALSRSHKRKEKEIPPSIAKAAEITLAETEADKGRSRTDAILVEEDEWVNIRPGGHSKTASEPTIGSLREKKPTPKIPSFLPPSTPKQQGSISQLTPPSLKSHVNAPSPSPSPSRPHKQRRSSLRAGAFLEIFRSVPGLTP